MNTIDQIKVEIERRIEELGMSGSVWVGRSELKELLSFIESLEKEPKCKVTEEITSNPMYNPNHYDELDSCKTALWEIATILSQYEDKDGSPLEQIRSIIIDNTIERMEKEKSEIPTIKGWVARDESGDLKLFRNKPYKSYYYCWWYSIDNDIIYLEKSLFPDLIWESEPIEVELTIHRV